MEARKMFYLATAAVMLVVVIINVLMIKSVAAETSNSSSITSSQSSSVSTSSSSVSESTPISQAASSSNTDTKSSLVVPQADPVVEPAAPTTADGVQSPSWDGIYFIVPIITGFTTQPQSEQYLVAGSNGTAALNMSFDVSLWLGLLTRSKVTPTRWTWDAAGNKWVKSTDPKYTTGVHWSGNPTINMPTVNLPVGTYYFQYTAELRSFIGIIPDKRISKLAKVKVVPAPIDANDVEIDTPDVVFEHATYKGTATTDPVDATGKITWDSTLNGDTTWNQKVGRDASFIINKQPTDVNASTTKPGIPKLITATIDNVSGSKTGDHGEYVGGLPAKVMAVDAGGTWSLDSQGLVDLEKSVKPEDGSTVNWSYKWQYSTDRGSSFTDITAQNGDGVSNFTGTATDITKLADPTNTLTFSRTSKFIQAAAAKPYVLKAVLTAKVVTSDGNTQTLIINSNKAQLNVTPAVGKLSLDSVPSYNFDNITVTDIYNGTQGEKSAKTSSLAITDTRADSNKYWGLSAKMTKMISDKGTQLENNIKILNNVNGETTVMVTDNNTDNLTLTRSNGGSLTTPITGQLYVNANHKTQLTNNEHFSSEIIWTLTTANVKEPVVK